MFLSFLCNLLAFVFVVAIFSQMVKQRYVFIDLKNIGLPQQL